MRRGTVLLLLLLLLLLPILAALTAAAARFGVPVTGPAADWLTGAVSARLGVVARAERIGLRLDGGRLNLRLDTVALEDPATGATRLRLDRLDLALDPWRSLRARAPVPTALTLTGARLGARRLDGGLWSLGGLEALVGGDQRFVRQLLTAGRLRLGDATLDLRDGRAGHPPDGTALATLTGLDLDLARVDGLWRLELRIATLAAGPLADLAALALDLLEAPGAPALAARLATLRAGHPRGRVDDLRLTLDRPADAPDAPPRWRVTGRAVGLGLDPVGNQPGIAGLDATFDASPDGGTALLSGDAVALDARPAWRAPLALGQLAARLDWQPVTPAGGWRIALSDARLQGPDLNGEGRLDLTLPADGADPLLEARARLGACDLARLPVWLPAGRLPPRLRDWLETALPQGRLTGGELLLRGPLAAFPFRGHEGRFELTLPFADVLFRYRPDWPPIVGAAGTLRFIDQGLTVAVTRGRILDSDLTGGTAEIVDLGRAPRLHVRAGARGPFADGRRILAETPLSARLGPLAEHLDVTGDLGLDLTLDLPLRPGSPLALAGELSWPGAATLRLRDTPLTLTRLAGRVHFTQDSLSSESLRARLWERPVRLTIATTRSARPAASPTVRIDASATTPVSTLLAQFPALAGGGADRILSGDLDWTLGVDVPAPTPHAPAAPLVDWRLTSSLRQVGIDLPAPFGKPRGAARPLTLSGRLRPGQALELQGQTEALGLRLVQEPARPPRAHLRFGGGMPPAPTRAGWFVDGALPALDVAAWLDWLQRQSGARARSDAPFAGPSLNGADLLASDLRWGGARLGRLELRLEPVPAGLRLTRLNLDGQRLLRVRGQGGWTRAPDGGHSQLALDLDTPDLGALLKTLAPGSGIDDAPASARLALDWPGGLADLRLTRASGTLDLRVAPGRLLKLEPGVGRLLGIVNLGALSRRLALDFSDLYGRGFAFERMEGQVRLAGGQLRLDDFIIAGPASTLRVSGLTDLERRRFDQQVILEPRLGSGVALASAVAGGPAVGAAVYLVDRAAGGVIDRLGRTRYRVTGPWDTPAISRVGWEPGLTDAASK